jgi:hypothetical protein
MDVLTKLVYEFLVGGKENGIEICSEIGFLSFKQIYPERDNHRSALRKRELSKELMESL